MRGLNRSKTSKYVDATRENNAPSRTMRIVPNKGRRSSHAVVAHRRRDLAQVGVICCGHRHLVERGKFTSLTRGVVRKHSPPPGSLKTMTMRASVANPETILERIRRIALSLADTDEVVTWGHPTFRGPGKRHSPFLRNSKRSGAFVFAWKKRTRNSSSKTTVHFLTPYIGKFGWVSLRVHAAPLDWKEIRQLITESHRLNGLIKR